MITAYHKDYLSDEVAFWTTSVDNDNVPDIVRCTGIIVESGHTLRCFFSDRYSRKFRANLEANGKLAVFATNVVSFTGYQYKGIVTAIAKCSNEEIDIQRKYLKAFTEVAMIYGLDNKKLFELYFHQPSFSVTMQVQNIFEQTPKQNTGGEILQ